MKSKINFTFFNNLFISLYTKYILSIQFCLNLNILFKGCRIYEIEKDNAGKFDFTSNFNDWGR